MDPTPLAASVLANALSLWPEMFCLFRSQPGELLSLHWKAFPGEIRPVHLVGVQLSVLSIRRTHVSQTHFSEEPIVREACLPEVFFPRKGDLPPTPTFASVGLSADLARYDLDECSIKERTRVYLTRGCYLRESGAAGGPEEWLPGELQALERRCELRSVPAGRRSETEDMLPGHFAVLSVRRLVLELKML